MILNIICSFLYSYQEKTVEVKTIRIVHGQYINSNDTFSHGGHTSGYLWEPKETHPQSGVAKCSGGGGFSS